MFKLRGRPDDPRNKKMMECHAALAEAICVNSLTVNEKRPRAIVSSVNAKQKEIIRRRHNFEEFRLTYERKLRKTQKAAEPRYSESRMNLEFMMKRFGIQVLDQNVTYTEESALRKIIRPREQLHAYKVEVPFAPSDETIRNSSAAGEGEHFLGKSVADKKETKFLEKFREAKVQKEKEDGKAESSDEGIQADFMKELNEANKQIDVASTQLEQIQKLLGRKYLAPVQEEEEEEVAKPQPKVNNRETRTKAVQQSKTSLTLWKKKTVNRQNDFQRKRIFTTLETLNKRLQKMQDKFFNRPQVHYRSINEPREEIPAEALRPQKKVEILYENACFPNQIEGSTELIADKKDVGTAFDIDPNTEAHCDVCQSHQMINRHKHFEEMDKVAERPMTVNVIYAPQIGSAKNSPRVRRPTKQKNEKESPKVRTPPRPALDQDDSEENITVSEIFKPKIQESIMKSYYLMKEFRVDPKDIVFRSNRMGTTKEANVNYLQAPVGNQGDADPAKEKKLYSHLNSALRNSLYSAFE